MILTQYWRAFAAVCFLLLVAAAIGLVLTLVEYVWSAAVAWLALGVAVLAWGVVDYRMSTAFDAEDELITHVTSERSEHEPSGRTEDAQ